MNHRLISVAALMAVAVMAWQAQKHTAQSATSTVGWPPAPMTKFVASTEKTFDQLMTDTMNVMPQGNAQRGIHRRA